MAHQASTALLLPQALMLGRSDKVLQACTCVKPDSLDDYDAAQSCKSLEHMSSRLRMHRRLSLCCSTLGIQSPCTLSLHTSDRCMASFVSIKRTEYLVCHLVTAFATSASPLYSLMSPGQDMIRPYAWRKSSAHQPKPVEAGVKCCHRAAASLCAEWSLCASICR